MAAHGRPRARPSSSRFDDVLDAGTDALLEDLGRLQRANMEEELRRFNLALAGDLILPEDF